MRFLLTILLVTFVGCSSVRDTATLNLSSEDREQITSLIRTETDEPIQMINPDSDIRGAVRVNTGYSPPDFNSGGKSFIIKKAKAGWIVIWRGSWIS